MPLDDDEEEDDSFLFLLFFELTVSDISRTYRWSIAGFQPAETTVYKPSASSRRAPRRSRDSLESRRPELHATRGASNFDEYTRRADTVGLVAD